MAMMLSRRSALALALLAPACGRKRSYGFPGYAFVANQDGGAIAAVDLTAFAVVRHIRVSGRPSGIVSNAAGVVALTSDNASLHLIDPGTLSFVRRIQVGATAVCMRPSSDALWVLCSEPSKLVRIDVKTLTVSGGISLPAGARDFDLNPYADAAAVAYSDSAVLAPLDGSKATRIDAGEAAGPVRFRSDGRSLLMGGKESRLLSVYDTATRKVITRLPLSVKPENFCFRGDGGQLFITGEGMDAVVVVYPHKMPQVAETVLAGHAPGPMAVSYGDPDLLFVTNPQSGNVTVLDVRSRRVISVISVGAEPGFVTVTPDNQYALVLNRRSGDMSVIRIAAITPKRNKFTPLFTMVPVGSRPVSAAVRAVI
jgi:YVTN family beta-propeller protein